jgi:hypothetical protein
MGQTTEGTYRVLASTRGAEEWLLLDVGTADPTYVPATGYAGDLAETVAELRPGNRIAAALSWEKGTPRFAALAIETRTEIDFFDGATGIFEVGRETAAAARRSGEGMNSRVLRGTDGEVSGVVYTFATQPGARDLFAEFRDGGRPLEPLIERLDRDAEPPYGISVIRPADEPFVLVCLALDPDGLLAETIRDTYERSHVVAGS